MPWPTTVEPIVRVQRYRPRVHSFIFASTKLLANSPAQKAIIEAKTMRGTWPNTASYAAWPVQLSAGGSATTTELIRAMNSKAQKPAQMQRLARA